MENIAPGERHLFNYNLMTFFFLAVINLFDITKCSKWLNRIGNTGKTCKSYTVVGALAYMLFFYLRNRYMGSNRQGKVGLSGYIQIIR